MYNSWSLKFINNSNKSTSFQLNANWLLLKLPVFSSSLSEQKTMLATTTNTLKTKKGFDSIFGINFLFIFKFDFLNLSKSIKSDQE